MEDGITTRKTPKPTIAISRNMAGVAIAIIGGLLALGFTSGKGTPRIKAPVAESSKPSPGSDVSMLPSSYADLPPPRPEPKPKVQVVSNNSGLSDLAKVLAQIEANREKRRNESRQAGVFFQGISLNKADSANTLPSSAGDRTPSESSQLNPRDNENRQDEKRNFLDSQHADDVYLHQRLISPHSKFQIMAGTIIPGLLLTGINSDLPGQILGQVSQNVFNTVDGSAVLIPQGTKVLGQYDSKIVYGQERVLVVWTRLIFPNGKSISLEGMPGVDLSGYAGLSDEVNNHYLKLLGGVVFSSLLGAAAQVAQGPTYNTIDPQYSQLAVQGVARNANEAGQEITRRNLNIQPTLEIRPGFRFNVFVHKDMVLEPYNLEE